MIHEQNGASHAESILEDFGFDTLPISPHDVAATISDENFKLRVEFHDFDSPSILGTTMGNGRGAIVAVSRGIPDPGRANFTLAHELGHVCLHIMGGQGESFRCGDHQIRDMYTDPLERQANEFASGLLMPRSLIRRISGTDISWNSIYKVSRACNTSLEASYRRLSVIGSEPSALAIHEAGCFKRFVKSGSFRYFLQPAPLTAKQLEQRHDGLASSPDFDFEEVDASDWVGEDRKNPIRRIYASSVALEDDFTYTLLNYDDDCSGVTPAI